YPYYVGALTWYMFEKFFREGRIPKRFRTYRAHLYLTFRNSIGEFPPPIVTSKRLDTYCKKLVDSLREDAFERRIREILDVFDECVHIWSKSKSRYGIKDNREFTDLLLEETRK